MNWQIHSVKMGVLKINYRWMKLITRKGAATFFIVWFCWISSCILSMTGIFTKSFFSKKSLILYLFMAMATLLVARVSKNYVGSLNADSQSW